MSDVLASLFHGIQSGGVRVIDLTQPLNANTPVIELPPQWGQTPGFTLKEISRYDDRGPFWYWNSFETGEHTGTHLDAPAHWATGLDKSTVDRHPYRGPSGPGWSSRCGRSAGSTPTPS